MHRKIKEDILGFPAFNFALSNVLCTWKVFALPRPHYYIKTFCTQAYLVYRKLETKYKKVLAFLASLFRFTLRPPRNKSLTIFIRQFKCDQFVSHKDKGYLDNFIIFVI